jgi:hypothetical protein
MYLAMVLVVRQQQPDLHQLSGLLRHGIESESRLQDSRSRLYVPCRWKGPYKIEFRVSISDIAATRVHQITRTILAVGIIWTLLSLVTSLESGPGSELNVSVA